MLVAGNGSEVLKAIDSEEPALTVYVMDIHLPPDIELDLLERVRRCLPDLTVVVYSYLSDFSEHPTVRLADAFVEKVADLTRLKSEIAGFALKGIGSLNE